MIYAQLAVIALSILGLLLYGPKVAHKITSLSLESPATLLTLSLAVSLAFSISIDFVLRFLSTSLNTFELFGFSKLLILPIVYLIIVLFLFLAKGNFSELRMQLPFWWWGLLISLFFSGFFAITLPRQDVQILPAVQGIGLIFGFLIFTLAGATPHKWAKSEQVAFLALFISIGTFAFVAQLNLGPFSPLVIPSSIVLLWLGFRIHKYRLFLLTLGLLVLVPTLLNENTLANFIQIVVGLGVLVVFVSPRRFRRIILTLGVLLALVGAIFSGLGKLLIGQGSELKDITLSHRAYETFAVLQQNASDPVSFLFGFGPSATVDLSRSPDVPTLLWSGRDVFRVDDVHFISSWFILKFGVIGLFLLIALFVWLLRELFGIVGRDEKIDSFVGSIWILALSGIAFGSPAATYIFTYPLVAISIGVLIRFGKKGLKQKHQSLSPTVSTLEKYPS